jgi:pimeloyl-ACP methyl ester carboxylesterase
MIGRIIFGVSLVSMVLCAIIELAQDRIVYGSNAKAGRYLDINGVKHYYESYGEGKPLLLIHGNRTGIKGHAAQIDYFSKRYKVYAIDCRGRGRSELGKDTLTYMQQANDMARFLQLLNLDSVVVIGKSDGAIIALLMGIYFPERVGKIISFGANLWPDTTAMYPETVNEIKAERLKADSMLAKKDTHDNWYLVQQRNRLMEFQPHIGVTELSRIRVPVLVMSCDRDVIKEEHTLFIYRHIPRASLAILNGETHHVARQNPELFNATAYKFLLRPFRENSYRFAQ